MSDSDRNPHDPVIDRIGLEGSDGEIEEVVPSTPGQEHIDLATPAQDNASLLSGAFNGDSLGTAGSPFKKSYSSGSLGEASIDSLVDENLPIESAALSPFRMEIESIHNSPLPSRSKDSHSFDVSVSDSLPPHVMELDSPEHDYGERLDIDHDVTIVKDSDEEDIFEKEGMHGTSSVGEVYSGQDVHSQKISVDEEPAVLVVATKDGEQLEREIQTTSTCLKVGVPSVPPSQGDMFASQSSPLQEAKDSIHEPPAISSNSELPISCCYEGFESLSKTSEQRLSQDEEVVAKYTCEAYSEDVIPSSDVERHSEDILQEVEDCTRKESVFSLSISSPLKRKREFLEESKEDVDNKILKKDLRHHDVDGSDSDIEILEENTTRGDQSIEVVYDKMKDKTHHDTELEESQDLNLIFTGTSQSQVETQQVTSLKDYLLKESKHQELSQSSQSQSLLSMPDTENLLCKDTLSPSPEEIISPTDNTIRATQVELLCQPADCTQPNIERLLEYPIKGSDVNSNGSKSNESTNMANNEVELEKETIVNVNIPLSLDSQEYQSSENNYSSQNLVNTSVVSYPQFDTPSFQEPSQNTMDSIFIKTSKATEEKILLEKKVLSQLQLKEYARTSDSFSSSSNNGELNEQTSDTFTNNTDKANSNQLTSLSAIKSRSSSHSTPVSSHVMPASPSSRLFPHASAEHKSGDSNKSYDKDSSQRSQIYAEDSDDELKEKSKIKEDDKMVLNSASKKRDTKTSTPNTSNISSPHVSDGTASKNQNLKTSTPNTSNVISPNLSEGGNYINKDSHTRSTNSSHNQSTGDLVNADKTQEILETKDIVHYTKDEIEGGWIKALKTVDIKLRAQQWTNPITKEVVYITKSLFGDFLVDSGTALETSPSSNSSGSKGSRISDVSSISRATTSSGYLGDKSSSSNQSNQTSSLPHFDPTKFESTRLSMASVTTIGSSFNSPPRNIGQFHEGKIPESDLVRGNDLFALPSLPILLPKSSKISTATQTDSSDEASIAVSSQLRRSRGRGRPRGRGRGRGRILKAEMSCPTPVKEEDHENDNSGTSISNTIPSTDPTLLKSDLGLPDSKKFVDSKTNNSKGKKDDDILSLLPIELQEALESAQIPFSEEEEEIFMLQRRQYPARDNKLQHEEVLRRVRVANICQNMLVFARYLDGNYYSAIVKKHDRMDKWEVHYNLDNCVNSVREVFILPTDILPKGLACYVRQPKQKYSDPGIVTGHIYQNRTLIHLVEIQRGAIIKAAHSHLILKETVANELLEPRLAFHSMIASPGGDVSLDNIVAGKRRKDISSSPQSKIFSPLTRKPDSNLDSSETNTEKRVVKGQRSSSKTTEQGKGKLASTSESSSDFEPISPTSSKSSKRKLHLSSPKTPKGRGASRTPIAKKTISRTPKSKRKDEPKETTELASPKSKRKTEPQDVTEPTSLDVIISKDTLMNPVVELIQLAEVAISSKSTPKKRGRKPGSTRNPRKMFKVGDNSSKEAAELENPELDARLGPLPPEGSQLFKGYTILITQATSSQQAAEADTEENLIIPLDKAYLREQFTRGQGRVIETFDEAYSLHIQDMQSRKPPPSNSLKKLQELGNHLHILEFLPAVESPSKVLCISNSHSRTAKFIQCLTVGIPLVSSSWIICSIKKNECLNWLRFLLPAGMSLLTGNLMEQPFSDSLKDTLSSVGQVAEVLKGEKVFLATSSNPAFGELWLNLLSAADAQVFVMPPKGGNIQRLIDRRTSVVISDSTIPPEEKKRANEAGVPIVSSEWFIQSLIARCKLPYDAHPDFVHDCKSKTAPEHAEETSNR